MDGVQRGQHHRAIQRRLWEGGFAGICYPREYGGLGLTPAHQRAFNEEVDGYEMPTMLNTPTLSICGPTILEMGSEEMKRTHLPAVMRGDEVLVQFLSEPSGGSDLAAVTTRATRDGDSFILNGAKTWSSSAYAADYALCLARTDWDVPKHSGLTMFLIEVHQPGITINRIKQVTGDSGFCEEFLDDVRVPLSAVVGRVNEGWAVVTRELHHERNAVGGGSPFVSGPTPTRRVDPVTRLIDLVRRTGANTDVAVRELVAEYHSLGRLADHLVDHVAAGIRSGDLPDAAGSIIRLFSGESESRRAEIALTVAGSSATMSDSDLAVVQDIGVGYLFRQSYSLGGGSTEMARNIISERVLAMPREYAADRGIPFNQVKRGGRTEPERTGQDRTS